MEELFLLGGHDLEMMTIAFLLVGKGRRYVDRNLFWGARLSSYNDILNEWAGKAGMTIYGIELIEDDAAVVPPNYRRIDHHNRMSQAPTALEQVAAILRHPLSRYEQLVAANDSGYIPAMEALGAVPEEIAAIRAADRKAQGVTEEEEKYAARSVQDIRQCGAITLLYTHAHHFSPLVDRLYPYRQLLIRSDRELVYYGAGVSVLVKAFSKWVDTGAAFYGGGESGFFGIAEGRFGQEKLKEIETDIIKLLNHDL